MTDRMPAGHSLEYRLLRGHFKVFCPAGANPCTSGGEIWRAGVSFMPNSTPISVQGWGMSLQNVNFTKFQNINAKNRGYPMRDSYEICRICRQFLYTLVNPLYLGDSLDGIQSLGILKFGVHFPPNFPRP